MSRSVIKIIAVIETISDLNGVTGEQIIKLQKTAEDRPILRNSDNTKSVLGIIRKAYMLNGALYIEADWTAVWFKETFFLVPIHTSEYELLACGTTLHPMNKELPPVQIISEEKLRAPPSLVDHTITACPRCGYTSFLRCVLR